jgi:hypothetical protein
MKLDQRNGGPARQNLFLIVGLFVRWAVGDLNLESIKRSHLSFPLDFHRAFLEKTRRKVGFLYKNHHSKRIVRGGYVDCASQIDLMCSISARGWK